ncbi:hypothetical protein KVT40_007611 [Elsinoe batatas]|uniref:Nonsense-mediated mRNA decay factor n=1 Tax=Elsinoe batatas TaxID=2601811 RepID=A0A8K0KV91_9PEZI|nr:hypothetical protein KVT40_007611 [Elsinoe batatas]
MQAIFLPHWHNANSSRLRNRIRRPFDGVHLPKETSHIAGHPVFLEQHLRRHNGEDVYSVADYPTKVPRLPADPCPSYENQGLSDNSIASLHDRMGDPSRLPDQIIRKQREQAKTCCGQVFGTLAQVEAHRASQHPSPRTSAAAQRETPTVTSQGVVSGILPSITPNFALRDASIKPAVSDNASNSPTRLLSRSQTPQTASAENAQMQISRLSLEEVPANLTGKPSELASHIKRTNTNSPSKKRPASSEVHGHRSSGPRPIPRQVSRRVVESTSFREPTIATDEFRRSEPRSRNLFDPNKAEPVAKSASSHQQVSLRSTEIPLREVKFDSTDGLPSSLKREASSNSISKDQLFAEVKGLYRSLEIVEQRCIRLDQTHMADKMKQMQPEEWQALTALHRTLLYEHHDFLLASQHPSAPPELRALASERQIPFRMWKYAIHAYLELLRQKLPESLEFMEAFIYLSYQMMALLYETVTLFEDVWTECLGDLARYRMAIENHSISVREVWTDVARYWYTKASDRQPIVGRLYHHLGILARPHLPQQLYYYAKSLCCVQPFANAKHSIKAVFESASQVLTTTSSEKKTDALQKLDATFVQMHAQLYEKQSDTLISLTFSHVQVLLRENLSRPDKKWKQYGVFLMISNVAACFSYGAFENPLRRSMEQKTYSSSKSSPSSDIWIQLSIRILSTTTDIMLASKDHKNMLPLFHVLLVVLDSLCNVIRSCHEATSLLVAMPWMAISTYLNDLAKSKENMADHVKNAKPDQKFIPQVKEEVKPLTEDFSLRGLVWCKDYFPEAWFRGNSNDELPFHEPASCEIARAQRCLWLAVKISAKSTYLNFDKASCTFEPLVRTDRDVELI